jgi:pimeloyl-ACP methyl ester carboxylesterase
MVAGAAPAASANFLSLPVAFEEPARAFGEVCLGHRRLQLALAGRALLANGRLTTGSLRVADGACEAFRMPYVDVGDLHLYYENDGEENAPPAVLLHGAGGTVDDPAGWALLREVMARRHRLYLIEHRGHGRTNNPLGVLTFAQLTADLIALLEVLSLPPVYLGGISDGGVAALGCCLARPDLVAAAALIGTNYCVDARTTSASAEFEPDQLIADQPEAGEILAGRHDPENYTGYWRDLLHQVIEMNSDQPSWSQADLATCTVPLLLIAGENDPFANTDQIIAMKRSLPTCELLIVNHAGHAVHYEHTAFVAERIADFFARN